MKDVLKFVEGKEMEIKELLKGIEGVKVVDGMEFIKNGIECGVEVEPTCGSCEGCGKGINCIYWLVYKENGFAEALCLDCLINKFKNM